MRSDSYLVLISICITAFATVLSVLLSAEWLSGSLFFVCMLVAFVFGLALAGWHHNRVHRRFLVDAAILSMAVSLGVLVGILATIITAGLIASFSSVPYLLAAGVTAFVAGSSGVFVLATVSTFRRERTHHVVQGSLLIGFMIACIAIAATYGIVSHVMSTSLEEGDFLEGHPEDPMLALHNHARDAYRSLNGTLIQGTYDRIYHDALRTPESALGAEGCETVFIDVMACADRAFRYDAAKRESVLDVVISGLVFRVSEENLTRTDSEALTTPELARLEIEPYRPPTRLDSKTLEDARTYYELFPTERGFGVSSILDPQGYRSAPMIRALHEMAWSTDLGEMYVRHSLYKVDRMHYLRSHSELLALNLLLEEEPQLATDPRFASIARELLDDYDARRQE